MQDKRYYKTVNDYVKSITTFPNANQERIFEKAKEKLLVLFYHGYLTQDSYTDIRMELMLKHD